MGRQLAVAAVLTFVIGLAVAGGVWLFGDEAAAPAAGPPPTAPVPAPGPDGPPNHADNRAHLQPGDLTGEQERALTEEAARMEPALAALSATDRLSPDAVRAVLVGLGYSDDEIDTVFRPEEYGGLDRVVVGVSFPEGGCVSGGVWTDRVRLLATGRIPEWGCVPPDAH